MISNFFLTFCPLIFLFHCELRTRHEAKRTDKVLYLEIMQTKVGRPMKMSGEIHRSVIKYMVVIRASIQVKRHHHQIQLHISHQHKMDLQHLRWVMVASSDDHQVPFYTQIMHDYYHRRVEVKYHRINHQLKTWRNIYRMQVRSYAAKSVINFI